MTYFPKAKHIPKGLWLTEGTISVPWKEYHPVALNSGFIEFQDEFENLYLVHELQEGAIYRPVLTNHAGLYRYRLGDLVKVTGYISETPSLSWVGRADCISDLCGEKLSEAEVAQAINVIGWDAYCVLMPVCNESESYYVCFISGKEERAFPKERFEAELQKIRIIYGLKQLGNLA